MLQRRGIFPCTRGHGGCRAAARQGKWGCGEGALGRTALQTKRRRISTALETIVKPLRGARPSTAAAMKGTTDSVSLDDAIWSQVMPRARLWVRGEPRGVGGPGAPLAGAGRAGSHPAPGMAPPASPQLVPLQTGGRKHPCPPPEHTQANRAQVAPCWSSERVSRWVDGGESP